MSALLSYYYIFCNGFSPHTSLETTSKQLYNSFDVRSSQYLRLNISNAVYVSSIVISSYLLQRVLIPHLIPLQSSFLTKRVAFTQYISLQRRRGLLVHHTNMKLDWDLFFLWERGADPDPSNLVGSLKEEFPFYFVNRYSKRPSVDVIR